MDLAVLAQAAGSDTNWLTHVATETGPLMLVLVLLAWLAKTYLDKRVVKPNGGSSVMDHINANGSTLEHLDSEIKHLTKELDDLIQTVRVHERRTAESDSKLHARIDPLAQAIARIEGKLDH